MHFDINMHPDKKKIEDLRKELKHRKDHKFTYILNKIRKIFDRYIYLDFNSLFNLLKEKRYSIQKQKFLLKCRMYDVIPKHISDSCRNLYVNMYSFSQNNNLHKLITQTQKKILNLEINDIIAHLGFLSKEIEKIKRRLYDNIDNEIVDELCNFYNIKINKEIFKHKQNLDEKFSFLIDRFHDNNSVIKVQFENNKRAIANKNFQLHDNIETNTNPLFDVDNNNNFDGDINNNLDKDRISQNNNIKQDDNKVNTDLNSNSNNIKWFVNLTDIDFPEFVKSTLNLGDKFNFTINNDNKTIFNMFKDLESSLKHTYLDDDSINTIRNKIVNSIEKNCNKKIHISINDRILNENIQKTKQYIQNNKDRVLFTKADKGNITVAIDRQNYIEKVESNLSDAKYYVLLKRNPLNKLIKDTNSMLENWNNKFAFDMGIDNLDIELKTHKSNLPRCYGLIKVHKKDFPIRVIVSSINSPTHKFAKVIAEVLKKYIPQPKSYVKNSLEVKKLIDNIKIPVGYSLVSLDVVSLFNNVPSDLVIKSIRKRWKFLQNKISLSCEEFLEGIEFLMNTTFFQFNNNYYKQILGLPMGSPLSPILANFVLEDLEISCLDKLMFEVPIYIRYVDDIFTMIPNKLINYTLEIFNNYNVNLQFTSEIESENKISFLDLNIIRENDNKVITDWYRKPTFSGRYLNFYSHHQQSTKRGIVFMLVDKCMNLSHPKFFDQNLHLIKEFLIENNYPIQFIEYHMKNRIKFLNKKRENNNVVKNIRHNIRNNKIVLPYVKHLNPEIQKILKNHNINLINKTSNKLNSIIRLGKDTLDAYDKCDSVYKIECEKCDAAYIGQSSRQLKTRINEHKKDVKNKSDRSALVQHIRLNNSHNFNFENVKILDIEKNYSKRLISEMLHIHDNPTNINRILDTQNLKTCYKKFIKTTKNNNKK